jgi:hypothetical protein
MPLGTASSAGSGICDRIHGLPLVSEALHQVAIAPPKMREVRCVEVVAPVAGDAAPVVMSDVEITTIAPAGQALEGIALNDVGEDLRVTRRAGLSEVGNDRGPVGQRVLDDILHADLEYVRLGVVPPRHGIDELPAELDLA